MNRILFNICPLSKTLFRYRQKGRPLLDNIGRNDAVPFGKPDSYDAARSAAHGPHIFFVETNGKAFTGADNKITLAGGSVH